MISYEVPLLMSSLGGVMITGSLNANTGLSMRRTSTPMACRTGTSSRPGDSRAPALRVAATAETIARRSICPKASRSCVARLFTEYSGFKFALFSWASMSA